MKIKKTNKNSVASTNTIQGASNYSEAISYISSAISSLSVSAKDDVLAKESIANLSVVLLDLKHQ